MKSGADYVDARFYTDDNSESLFLNDGNLEGNSTSFESGLGVRVLFGGAWGFAATSNINDLTMCFELAKKNAKTASTLMQTPLDMGVVSAHKGSYCSPVEIDPFDVPLKDKLDFLFQVDNSLKADWITKRYVMADIQKKNMFFFNSEGTEVERKLTNIFAKMLIMALDKDGQMQRRSKDIYTTGKGTRGW